MLRIRAGLRVALLGTMPGGINCRRNHPCSFCRSRRTALWIRSATPWIRVRWVSLIGRGAVSRVAFWAPYNRTKAAFLRSAKPFN